MADGLKNHWFDCRWVQLPPVGVRSTPCPFSNRPPRRHDAAEKERIEARVGGANEAKPGRLMLRTREARSRTDSTRRAERAMSKR